MNISETEKKIIGFWRKDKTFEKSLKKTENKKPYIFYDGPPFATGLPHYGHILSSTTKDVFGRFWTMNGRYVRRVWGWDCHGLPIENIAEKELKINSKDEIEKLGVKKFNDFCRSKVLGFADEWKEKIERIGRWVEFDNSYKTMDNDYIESVWWAFKKLWEKGYIYEGEKILMYCPRCSTPLSKSEIAMDNSYRTVKDHSITIKFKLKEKIKGKDVFALAWTTTPWTLPSNLALTVNPDLEYVYLKDKENEEIYLIAKSLVEKFYKNKEGYEVLKKVRGRGLKGKEYEPLFDYFKDSEEAFRVLTGKFVTDEDGTGIVHTAPAFGEDDYNVCKENNISMVQPVDEKGRFTDPVRDFKGEYIFDANKKIVDFLKKKGKIVKVEKTEHEYPFCYRCDTPLMYRAIPAWFVNVQKIKLRLLELNKKINWYPEFLKNKRVSHNIKTAPDWNISRNRYWATAIPVWKSNTGKIKVIGSVEELKKYAKKLPKGNVDLHKDYLDPVVLEIDGEEYKRIPEVMDCWFESGTMPFAQFHYPFENKNFFEDNFPSQFVAEYIGQVRAWFYYMMVLSGILFDDIPFENVLTTGTILAKDGNKMSKSKGNFTDPMILAEKYGVDSLRFYLLSSQLMNAEDLNFSDKGVEEIYKKVVLLLYNVNRFYSLYKKEGDEKHEKPKELIDKWIVSRTKELIKGVSGHLKNYNTIKACDFIRDFVDDLSTWYVKVNRERFNEGDRDARKTLNYVLENLSRVIGPIMPFSSEVIYQTLHSEKDSVHLQDYPKSDGEVDGGIIKGMEIVREIVSKGLKERDKNKVGLRWPLRLASVSYNEEIDKNLYEIIKKELNVKDLEYNKTNSEEIEVEVDFNMTPELEEEGYAREISRQVQAFRKNLGLRKEEKVNVVLSSDKETLNRFEKQKEFIQIRTNAKELKLVSADEMTEESFKNTRNFEIKEKRGIMAIETSSA